MDCPYYTSEELKGWEDVANPMGPECNSCGVCECIHWVGFCSDCERCDCPDPDRALYEIMMAEELKQGP